MLQTFNKNFVFVQLNLYSELFIKLHYDLIKNIVFNWLNMLWMLHRFILKDN